MIKPADVVGMLLARQDDTDLFNGDADSAKQKSGITFQTFLASLLTGLAIFGAEFVIFYLFKGKFKRIYAPRTYLVPERERTNTTNDGFIRWVVPVFKTSNSEYIQKCGLDAYLFLRYLRMLLKIFLPISFVTLPILLPLNRTCGDNSTGMDRFSWVNVDPPHFDRKWAHCFLAVLVILYVCYLMFDEMRKFIRLRQAYLTSPQHRLRASATTVLVQNIPRKWLSLKALDELYDVFPGGVRNIWLNRDFEELSDKVKERNRLYRILENAETTLIKKAVAKAKKGARDSKNGSTTSLPQSSHDEGHDVGNPHQIPHNSREEAEEAEAAASQHRKRHIPSLGQGLNTVEHGLHGFGHGVKNAPGDVAKGVSNLRHHMADAQTGYGFDTTDAEEDEMERKAAQRGSRDVLHHTGNEHINYDKPTHNIGTVNEDQIAAHRTMGDPLKQFDQSNGTWKFWGRTNTSGPPGPRPSDDSQYPLRHHTSPRSPTSQGSDPAFRDEKKPAISTKYPKPYRDEFLEDGPEALWRKYLTDKDRETMRLPALKYNWWPTLPFVGPKVDAIYHCRKELARLNSEIEIDQQEPEKFPLMNSAFIQFNHQVAAHMACQSASHHLPKYMYPRTVEISPDDVIWDNLSIKWWERYVRLTIVLAVVVGIIILWAIPVAITGLLSQIHYLADNFAWLEWLEDLPDQVQAIITGVLPPALLAALLAVLPIVFRLLARISGHPTHASTELKVQIFYFSFLFIQVFLVVTLSSGLTKTLQDLADDTVGTIQTFSRQMPSAANYFFSYMILQALSVSAGALVQIAGLFFWFIWGPIMDTTARQKFERQRKLPEIKWGSFFPVYTNLAVIGIIYSVISPLISVFCIITFSLFWMVYRYQTLYVNAYKVDTGGLLFPKAINQLFVGLYVMEVVLAALFFTSFDGNDEVAGTPMAIIMIICGVFTLGFQLLFNDAFGPLTQYIPITMEDEAVIRDQEFARAQNKRFGLAGEAEGENLTDALKRKEKEERQADKDAEEIEMRVIEANREREHQPGGSNMADAAEISAATAGGGWAKRQPSDDGNLHSKDGAATSGVQAYRALSRSRSMRSGSQRPIAPSPARDVEAQRAAADTSDFLFEGFHDEIEDLTPAERDQLVRRAFQHSALRANRPSVWIPRDSYGISDDEIRQTHQLAGENIWITNMYTRLDKRGRVRYSRPPPDFDSRELMQL